MSTHTAIDKPKALYKYVSAERTDVLRNGLIRFSSPADLNDPLDCKPHLSEFAPENRIENGHYDTIAKVFEEEYEALPEIIKNDKTRRLMESALISKALEIKQKTKNALHELTPILQEALWKKTEEILGILSLTESNSNHLMWSHYADSHRGFIIEFDPTSSFFDQRKSNDDKMRHIRKVLYVNSAPRYSLFSLEDFSPFLTKKADWNYEHEWRMFVYLPDAHKIETNNSSRPIHLFQFPRNIVKKVIIGINASDSLIRDIRQITTENEEYTGVVLERAIVSAENYCISSIPIE